MRKAIQHWRCGRSVAVVLSAALALVLAGCGGDEERGAAEYPLRLDAEQIERVLDEATTEDWIALSPIAQRQVARAWLDHTENTPVRTPMSSLYCQMRVLGYVGPAASPSQRTASEALSDAYRFAKELHMDGACPWPRTVTESALTVSALLRQTIDLTRADLRVWGART
jgi:hypothetical protein